MHFNQEAHNRSIRLHNAVPKCLGSSKLTAGAAPQKPTGTVLVEGLGFAIIVAGAAAFARLAGIKQKPPFRGPSFQTLHVGHCKKLCLAYDTGHAMTWLIASIDCCMPVPFTTSPYFAVSSQLVGARLRPFIVLARLGIGPTCKDPIPQKLPMPEKHTWLYAQNSERF